jgi:hypothetical protein
MKYLKYREDFLHREIKLDESKIREQIKSSEMISEAFENDITWGGSLIGRLFNSILRKGKVMIQTARVGSLVKSLKDELDALSGEVQLASDEKIKNKVYLLSIRFLVTEIYNIVVSNKTVAEKKGELVGDGSDEAGLIQVTIKRIESIPDESLPNKKELIEKLKRFREALIKLEVKAEPSKEEEEDDNSETNFYNQTLNLLKSIVSLNDVILNKKIKNTEKLEVGKEYINQNGKVCMIVSLDYMIDRPSIKLGGDGMFFTNDDKKSQKIESDEVFVEYRDEKTKQYTGNSPVQNVKRNQLKPYTKNDTIKDPQGKPLQVKPKSIDNKGTKIGTGSGQGEKEAENIKKTNDSYYYENESLPIFEDTDLENNETHAKAAWNKVLNTWNKTGISKMVPRIQELLKKSESGSKEEKRWIMDLGKQIILNKSTVGANPMKFDDLIKEAESIPTSYNDIPKAISLVSRVILSFKEDMGLLGALGDANPHIKLFVKSFDEMNKIYPNLKAKKKEEPKKEEEKTPEAQNASRLFNYSKFLSINEADVAPELDAENSENDEVKTAWSNEFKEGDEKEWKIEEKEAKELQKETDELENKETKFKGDDYYDHIIAIIEIFGKAYNLYATTVIPSGRPNGRISQKTFREYEFIGDGKNPGWKEGEGPEAGPWAAKQTYQKWQDGVMGILKDPKYRKILANVKFVSEAESSTGTPAKEGSGRSLFTFINDLTTGNGEFSKIKREMMNKYFTTKEMKTKGDNQTEGFDGNLNPTTLEEGTPNKAYFFNTGGEKHFTKASFKESGFYKNSFLHIIAKVGDKNEQFIIFVVNYVTTQNPNHIVIKFHKQDKGTIKQSMLTKFLSKRLSTTNEAAVSLKDDDRKLTLGDDIKYTQSENVYFGIVEMTSKIFEVNKPTKIKYSTNPNNNSEDVQELEIEVKEIKVLRYYDKDKKKNIIVNADNDKITEYPDKDKAKDLTKLGPLKSKFGIS